MQKFGSVLLFLMLFAVPSFGQYRRVPPPKKPRVLSFPAYSKYKKKDTVVKINPYFIDSLFLPVPMERALFHDNIFKEQVKADMFDGKVDSLVRTGADSLTTDRLSSALLYKVDSMRTMIENMEAKGRDAFADNQMKIRYLRAVWEMMRLFNRDRHPDPQFYIKLADNMHGMLIASNEDKMMPYVLANNNVYSLNNIREFSDKHYDARAYIYTQIGRADPRTMIKRLSEYAADSFAGEIIKADAPLEPEVIFNYATSNNFPLKNAVYKTQDDLVQAIVQIAAHSSYPLKAFPFLSDVYLKRKSIEAIDSLADRPDLYYNQLVRLRMTKETIAEHTYNDELKYRSLKYFVRPMNELHESRDDIRFRSLDNMPPTSLYYMMVNGQDEIYTSSFLGTFKRLIERMKPMKGDQLLDTLQYDHFRTFIRMCAGYNTLSEFLGTMDDTSRTMVMTRFISGLEHGKPDDLEDAVDVADAFGSIRDSALSSFLEKKVKENYQQSLSQNNKKGMAVYSLLGMLFEGNKISGNDTGATAASTKLKLPPINKVTYTDVVSDSGIVYQQMFFFGDKDGQESYENYISAYKRDSKWKVTTEKYWSVVSSTSGKRVVTYANLPLKEPEDAAAQDSLAKYLQDSNIHPTIVIHRGHSYHLAMTIARLTKDVKIVILGSCGGYHNLALVLDKAPDAHIISSKQTGVMAVNEPILRSMNTMLLQGADVNWITMWKELEQYFADKQEAREKFADYVPPYKNLGAIFIKAYRRMMATPPPPPPKNTE